MSTIQAGLQRVLSEYPEAKLENFKDHPLASFIRGELCQVIQKVVGAYYLVDASPGKGNWAHVPWVSIFDPAITTSARNGYYPVFSFSSNGSRLYLSLNQFSLYALVSQYLAPLHPILYTNQFETKLYLKLFL